MACIFFSTSGGKLAAQHTLSPANTVTKKCKARKAGKILKPVIGLKF